jgi:hypothetical protein
LYVKIKNWNPPPASASTEERMTLFEKKLREASRINTLQTHSFTSLSPLQRQTLKEFKNSKEFIIIPTDKNLGPAVLNRDDYISQVLKEHLLTPTYLKLNSDTASYQILQTTRDLKNTFQKFKHLLTKPEIDFFTRSFSDSHRTPIFYGMPKVHKTPMQLRPVVSCVNSFPSIFSSWLDFRMKELLHLVPPTSRIQLN